LQSSDRGLSVRDRPVTDVTDDPTYYSVEAGIDQALGADLRVAPEENPAGVAVVEHTLPPETLAAPLHRHSHEDEISYVLEGTMGVQEDGDVSTVGAGEVAVKQRGVWHTFWNPGAGRLRFLEFVVPGEFAYYFEEAAAVLADDPDEAELRARLGAIHDR
jgi:quercetin dioxygenase-like cupin family protein